METLILVGVFLAGCVAETSLGWGVKIKEFIKNKIS